MVCREFSVYLLLEASLYRRKSGTCQHSLLVLSTVQHVLFHNIWRLGLEAIIQFSLSFLYIHLCMLYICTITCYWKVVWSGIRIGFEIHIQWNER